jgi:alcohol dehydrogenase class IV
MSFEFRTAGRVIFGPGTSRMLPELCAEHGRRVFLVTGAAALERGGTLPSLREGVGASAETLVHWRVVREPDVTLIDEGVACCMTERCDVVLGVGGGSVLDAAKAVAALAINGGSVREYLEDVGRAEASRPITRPGLPTVLVPTTAGTGAEVTRNAVVGVPECGVKRSMRSDRLLPRVALVDSTLSVTAPRGIAAAAGLDALTQLVEGYVARAAQPLTDALVRDGVPLAVRGLHAIAAGTATAATHEGLVLASLYSGMVLANAGLGAAHGLAAPLGGRLGVAHGVACAALIPGVMHANVVTLRALAASAEPLPRFAEVTALLTGGSSSDPLRAAEVLDELRRDLGLPSVRELGIGADDVPLILRECRGGSMKSNPVALDDAALARILTSPLDELVA